jgi:SAM-dependent MidA family methyltransferase
VNQVVEKIAQEIISGGAIPFARFMGLALYCPVCGYYEKEEDTIGREGDYFTSVSVGSLFGELLAFQFAEWLGKEDGAAQLVEAGAHDGKLAKDMLKWLREHRPEVFARLEYWIVEPSKRQRQRQQIALAGFGNAHWAAELGQLPPEAGGKRVRRVIFANELLDALPVHRMGWDAKSRSWFEWGVGLCDGGFVWEHLPQSGASQEAVRRLDIATDLLNVLPQDFVLEICPAAETWWRQAAEALTWGKLLTIDYGLTTQEVFAPERKEGTLRAYHLHHSSSDVLAHAGEQDITAHVNFSLLQATGEAADLRTEAFSTQSQFLTLIAAQTWQSPQSFGEWTTARTRQLQTLTHPEHLGRSFRVLVQGRERGH